MTNNKGSYYDLYYKKLYKCLLENPHEFTCLVQEYNLIVKELSENTYDDFEFSKEKEFLNDLYHNVLTDAYTKGDINEDAYRLWKKITDDDPFPPLED